MKSFYSTLGLALFLSAVSLADTPKGFEDPAMLEKIMKGTIVKTTVVDTKMESKIVLKAYSNKTSTDAYIDLAINHAKYPALFPEFQDAKTTKVSEDKTEYNYWSDLIIQHGFLSLHVNPEGVQKITRAKETAGEAFVEHTLTNYKDLIEVGSQNTRLVPYDNGILIEDTVYVKVKQSGGQATMIKQKMVEQFTRFIQGFRKELGGDKP